MLAFSYVCHEGRWDLDIVIYMNGTWHNQSISVYSSPYNWQMRIYDWRQFPPRTTCMLTKISSCINGVLL